MPQPDATTQLSLLFKAVARQQLQQYKRRRDRRLLSQGRQRVLHAVDTDVVILYTNTWEKAPSVGKGKRKRKGYAEILPGQEREVSIAMGAALSKVIFHRLNGHLPLLVLPAMEQELGNVLAAVMNQAEDEGKDAQETLEKVKTLLDKAENSGSEGEDQLALLREHLDTLQHFIYGEETAVAELNHFTELLGSTRIASPEYIIENQPELDGVWQAALEPPLSLQERIDFLWLRNKWFDRLYEEKSTAKHSVLTDVDAQVLARLEWINNCLTPTWKNDDGYRLVLITGDQSLHAAAEKVEWPGSRSSFGELFLRHPRCYLGEPGVFSPPDGEGGESQETPIDEWLDTFLARLNPGSLKFPEMVREVAEKDYKALRDWVAPMSKRDDLLKEFQIKWQEYSRNLALNEVAYSSNGYKYSTGSSLDESLVKKYKRILEQLENDLHERIHKTWDECFRAIANGSGFSLFSQQGDDNTVQPRNAPLLMFSRLNKAREFVDQVLQQYKQGDLDAKKWNEGLKEIQDEDNTGYAFYLALGTLFASEGIWKVAAILAQRALDIAMQSPAQNENESSTKNIISGREAYYLRAVSLRHAARKMDDLLVIEDLLHQAEEAHRKDVNNTAELRVGPCRFQSERLALYLTYNLFQKFLRADMPDKVPKAEQLLTEIDMALKEFIKDEPVDLQQFVERNLLINWLMCVILLVGESVSSVPERAIVQEHWERLDNNLKNTRKKWPVSYYMMLVERVSAWLIQDNKQERRNLRRECENLLNMSDDKCVLIYDEKKFLLFADLLSRNVRIK